MSNYRTKEHHVSPSAHVLYLAGLEFNLATSYGFPLTSSLFAWLSQRDIKLPRAMPTAGAALTKCELLCLPDRQTERGRDRQLPLSVLSLSLSLSLSLDVPAEPLSI